MPEIRRNDPVIPEIPWDTALVQIWQPDCGGIGRDGRVPVREDSGADAIPVHPMHPEPGEDPVRSWAGHPGAIVVPGGNKAGETGDAASRKKSTAKNPESTRIICTYS